MVRKLFENKKKMIFKLKKDKYENYMKGFRLENHIFFETVRNRMEQAQYKEKEAENIAVDFVAKVIREFTPGKSSFFGDSLYDYNLHLVYYVFPALILEDELNGKMVAEHICSEWKKHFRKGQIGVMEYDTIYNSFKEKIFGIF